MPGKVQIGFIGAGAFVSAHHLRTVRESDIMEIRAIADLNTELLGKHSSSMPVGYTTTDYAKLLSDPQVDMVVVGTKQDLHARLIVESLQAGKWVYCEKPMAETDEDAQAVLAAEKGSPGKLAIGFNRRFAPAYADAKRLMQSTARPWYINYRLMSPNPEKRGAKSFYSTHERILYEGCHILDLVCWLLDGPPECVFMTGDRLLNNCCILEFSDGSQVSFMCGSMGTHCFWKEYMEIFADNAAIAVSDFVDMRVRGIPGEFDRLFLPHLGEHAEEVSRWGFDFYEAYKAYNLHKSQEREWKEWGHTYEDVRRPTPMPFDVSKCGELETGMWGLLPDKGWTEAVEHFARCYLEGAEPGNAGAAAGARSTEIALALLESLETGQPTRL